ncbi:DUF5830 family protein [Halomicrococcus sp. SG-WS-1]|uniref:DUF5830 family protein n=1 Tax=Halomicrococcus sp. SG-WS-1 TaxID=3439057 RepID=UPI003F79FC7D
MSEEDDAPRASKGPSGESAEAGESGSGPEADAGRRDGDGRDDPVALGVELLGKLEHAELSVAEAVDRIETITTDPTTTRTILDEAEKRGIVEREQGIIRPTGGGFVRFESEVVVKEGDFTCQRCGAGISEGHFVKLDAGEHGPFGSSCIRKVTGRD